MIIRMWFGKTKPENADAYVTHLRTSVFPELQGIGGFRGAQVLRRDLNNYVEFSVQTQWESMDAIRQFAGPEPTIAVVPPDAQTFLSEYDATVRHFEVAAAAEPK